MLSALCMHIVGRTVRPHDDNSGGVLLLPARMSANSVLFVSSQECFPFRLGIMFDRVPERGT